MYLTRLLLPFTLLIALLPSQILAAQFANPGFEEGWGGWLDVDKDGKSTALSKDARSGDSSLKITSAAGTVAQNLEVKPNTNYQLSVYVKGSGIVGVKMGNDLVFERLDKARKWTPLELLFNSGDNDKIAVFAQFNGKKSLFDDFQITNIEWEVESSSNSVSLNEFGLSPSLTPGKNFNLTDWYLSVPLDEDKDGRADQIDEPVLFAGYERKPYFYTADDGGMVFMTPIDAPKTSKNTKYPRSELREMLRRGDLTILHKSDSGKTNKNNWVFSTAPQKTQDASGGVDGFLKVTMAVNHVTTTGDVYQQGRVIIGQIHAAASEPVRIYYRKKPDHERGSIFIAHETRSGEETWIEMLGDRGDSAKDPKDGIALNEKFSYEIDAVGNYITVTIMKDGEDLASEDINISSSGYDSADEYMYFKVGAYNQNNTGEPDDYAQVTVYELENTHVGFEAL